MNELLFQRALIKAAKDAGGYGLKLSHMTMAGIPDLYIQMPGYPTAILECKRIAPKALTVGREYKVNVTPIQLNTLRKIQKAGGKSGIAVLIDNQWPQYIAVFKNVEQMEGLVFHPEYYLARKRGEPWPIEKMIQRVI